MAAPKREVGIRELKDNLSAALARARKRKPSGVKNAGRVRGRTVAEAVVEDRR